MGGTVDRVRTGRGLGLRTLIAVLAGVALVAASGCGESASPSEPAPDLESSTTAIPDGSPGTPLGDGFTVPDGTRLLGVPVPAGPTEVIDGDNIYANDGWTATLAIVGGDPLRILDEYGRQATAAGLTIVAEPACGQEWDVMKCSVFARTTDDSEPRSFSATVIRGPMIDVISDHVALRYSTEPLFWNHGQVYVGEPIAATLPAPKPAPLPRVGEPLGTAGEVTTELVITEGSELAGPVRLGIDDATGGIVAVLHVTGDPEKVLGDYLEQIHRNRVPDNGEPETRQVGDTTITFAHPGGGGGDYFTLTLIEQPGHPTWLIIDGGHD